MGGVSEGSVKSRRRKDNQDKRCEEKPSIFLRVKDAQSFINLLFII